jgi:hypothetical protein
VLWYNGDGDGRNGLSNELNTAVAQSQIYDDFTVTDDTGWTLTTVSSNNLISGFTAATATFEIRDSCSPGVGGNLDFTGTLPATQTPTGNVFFGITEYTISVDVSSLNISLAPGQYWLSVTPVGTGGGTQRSFNSTTSNANSVNDPGGLNVDSLWNSTTFGAKFWPGTTGVGTFPADFSMGLTGNVN